MYVVIGYGNALRRDDGAGLVLGQKMFDILKTMGHELVYFSVHQLTPELIYDLNLPKLDAVVFADTCVGGVEEAVVVEPVEQETPLTTMGHQMTPETFMVLLEGILGICVPAWIVRVPGWDFGFGEGVSKRSQRAMDVFLEDLDTNLQFVYMHKPLDHVAQ